MADTVKVDLYDANEGKAPRTGGPYRDVLERQAAEEWRAKQEGREPDLDNPPPTAATQLVPKSALREADVDKSHEEVTDVTVKPVQTVEVDVTETVPDEKQVDWDNDMSKVNAAQAKETFDKLGSSPPVAKASKSGVVTSKKE